MNGQGGIYQSADRVLCRKQPTKARIAAAAQSKQQLTLVLMKCLPDLLMRFQADAVKVQHSAVCIWIGSYLLQCGQAQRIYTAASLVLLLQRADLETVVLFALVLLRPEHFTLVFRPESCMQAAALVSMVRDVKLELYPLKQQQEAFIQLLRAVVDILDKHVDTAAVVEACTTLVHCLREAPEELKVQLLQDTCAMRILAGQVCLCMLPA